jgi:hypothetical protein
MNIWQSAWSSGDKTSTEKMMEYFVFLSACIGLSLIGQWWLDHQRRN